MLLRCLTVSKKALIPAKKKKKKDKLYEQPYTSSHYSMYPAPDAMFWVSLHKKANLLVLKTNSQRRAVTSVQGSHQ